MRSVFVAGSRALSRLNAIVKRRLDNIVKQDFTVLVGDANGADKAVQRYLAEVGYKHVVIYCMDTCRNNIGNWPTQKHSAESGVRRDRHYYGIKDIAMARDASCGFMIWDGISKGTLANVMNLLSAGKKVLLYAAAKKHFFALRTHADLNGALNETGIEDPAAFLAQFAGRPDNTEHLRFSFPSSGS
jgi:hypothetical protein